MHFQICILNWPGLNGVIISFFRNPDAPAPEGAPAPPGQTDSDDDMSSTSSFTDED